MSKDRLIKLNCTKCKRDNYFTRKNPKSVTRKVALKKHCQWCRATTPHKEKKV